jgi:predicted nucleic acid-binding protein
MTDRLILDTDVLIDYLRGNDNAIRFLEDLQEQLCVSVITVAELYAGIRNKKEQRVIEKFLTVFDVLPIDQVIAINGGLFRRQYGPSHGVGLADAMIAATAESCQARLVTLNQRHFPMLKVVVPYKSD